MRTASHEMERINLRHRRAIGLIAAVLNVLREHRLKRDILREVYNTLVDALMDEGVEVLTDYDRQQYGLPPRGPDGWTAEEIVALEKHRLDVLMRPLPTIMLTVPEGAKVGSTQDES